MFESSAEKNQSFAILIIRTGLFLFRPCHPVQSACEGLNFKYPTSNSSSLSTGLEVHRCPSERLGKCGFNSVPMMVEPLAGLKMAGQIFSWINCSLKLLQTYIVPFFIFKQFGRSFAEILIKRNRL